MSGYFRDAIRLLFILVEGSQPLSEVRDGASSIFRGEAKLHALDFWVRYPDYLAAELLDRFGQEKRVEDFALADLIMSSEEPDIRRIPVPLAQAGSARGEVNDLHRRVWSTSRRIVSGGWATRLSITRAAIRQTPSVLRRLCRKANSSR